MLSVPEDVLAHELSVPVFERENSSLQSPYVSLWGHSSHDRVIGRGVPEVSFETNPWFPLSLPPKNPLFVHVLTLIMSLNPTKN